jgi:hypothetical protein
LTNRDFIRDTLAGGKKTADKQPAKSERPRGRPFPKGVSGNPKGRPPSGQSLTEALKKVLGEEGKEAVAKKLCAMAMGKKPYFPALKYIYDRIDGEPIKAIQATVENWNPPIIITNKKDEPTDADEENPVEPPAETE